MRWSFSSIRKRSSLWVVGVLLMVGVGVEPWVSPQSCLIGGMAMAADGALPGFVSSPDDLPADLKRRVDAAVAKGVAWLLREEKKEGDPESSLAAYALLKAGVDKNHPEIRRLLEPVIKRVKDGGVYAKGADPPQHIYGAACDAMFLAEHDAEAHAPLLATLRDYFVRKQQSNGSWFYPYSDGPDAGDTSITQFAILGLWTVQRAGQEVPLSTLEPAANWLLRTQYADGSFVYQRHVNKIENTHSKHSMTVAGTACLMIVGRMLYPELSASPAASDPALATLVESSRSRKRFGVLEARTEDEPIEDAVPGPKPTITLSTLDVASRQGVGWLSAGYRLREKERFFYYYQYGVERVGALSGLSDFGGESWYRLGAAAMCDLQKEDGHWYQDNEAAIKPIPATSFALLFLVRATKAIVSPRPRIRLLGGGLQIGGRGLQKLTGSAGGQPDPNVNKTELDQLLLQLESPQGEVLEGVQEAVVELLQEENRDTLVGKVPRLKQLVRAKDPRVRATAAWALGRSDDWAVVPVLIDLLNDSDLDVAREASLGLCVLTRQPQGIPAQGVTGDLLPTDPPVPPAEPAEPVGDAPIFATPEQKAAAQAEAEANAIPLDMTAINSWRQQSTAAWKAWYLSIRPYVERDDRQTLRRANKSEGQ
jgi:hypothetical protein